MFISYPFIVFCRFHPALRMTRSDTTSELISQQVRRKEKRIVAVLGDTASGKTCLVKHMMEQDATASLAHHISTIDESHYTMKRMAGRLFCCFCFICMQCSVRKTMTGFIW